MYDPETLELIRSARPLSNLDLSQLPELLTEAYATVMSSRLLGRSPGQSAGDEAMIGRLGRLASTYEVITLGMRSEEPARKATAFVSASAHQAKSRFVDMQSPSELLGRYYLSPRVSAVLLFAIGEHQADAEEASGWLLEATPEGREGDVIRAVAHLATARGTALEQLAAEAIRSPAESLDLEEGAVDRLLWTIQRSIQSLAKELITGSPFNWRAELDWLFRVTQDDPDTGDPGFSAPGFRHLALLLSATGESMSEASVLRVPPPNGTDPAAWKSFLTSFARDRPLVWRNHAQMLRRGFLTSGSSAVLSFPTGAGKSTMGELRAGAELLRQRSVIYLAPTRALVAQVRRQLQHSLRGIGAARISTFVAESEASMSEFEVAVMTPESALVLLSVEPDAFASLGLIIFDECHILSGSSKPSTERPSRRSIDANIALLALLRVAPEADVLLLSAMVSNSAELASWLQHITGRPAIPYPAAWKPTRQLRGILAYKKDDLDRVRIDLRRMKNEGASATEIGAAVRSVPFGIFCHRQAWDPTVAYSVAPMLREPVNLSCNRWLQLTANRNQVAGQIAAAFVTAGIKPLVFVQTITGTTSAARALTRSLSASVKARIATHLAPGLLNLAGLELGDQSAIFGLTDNVVGQHQALLLAPEREAVEESYREANGIQALVATPTLAQGMNLPAQVVIIAGDNRWDAEEEKPATLPVHEILNAAGRAGRAGMFAQGLVFVVPGPVFHLETSDGKFSFSGLDHATSLLGSPDQCLEVRDPLIQVMDAIAAGFRDDEVAKYFVRRIQDSADAAMNGEFLRRSFGYWKRVQSDAGRHIAEKSVQATLTEASALDPGLELPTNDIARSLGSDPNALHRLYEALPDDDIWPAFGPLEWARWLTSYLLVHPQDLVDIVHLPASGLLRIFSQPDDEPDAEYFGRIAKGLEQALPLWLGGSPLVEIEPVLFASSGRKRALRKLDLSRRFHNDTSSALGSTAQLLRRLLMIRSAESGVMFQQSLVLDALPGCWTSGQDQPAKWLLQRQIARERTTTRVEVHQLFPLIADDVGSATSLDELGRQVWSAAQLRGLVGVEETY